MAVDPHSGDVLAGSVAAQTGLAVANLAAILGLVGASLADVIKVTAYLSDFRAFDEFDAAYRQAFTEPYPARTTVESRLGDFGVELDAIAVRDSRR